MNKILQLASLIFLSYAFSLKYGNFEAFAMFSASCLLVLELVEEFWRWLRFKAWIIKDKFLTWIKTKK